MEGLRAYLLSVTAAALVCGIVQRLLISKGTAANISKMVCGIFLALVAVDPLAKLQLGSIGDLTGSFELQASQAVADGQSETKKALQEIIKSRTEAYILDKASLYGSVLSVSVELSDDSIPIPISARLSGAVSPYAKNQLQAILEKDLGIAKENQLWT